MSFRAQCLLAALDAGKQLDQLSLQFDWGIVQNVAGAEGIGNYANSRVGVRPMVAAGVPGHQPLL